MQLKKPAILGKFKELVRGKDGKVKLITVLIAAGLLAIPVVLFLASETRAVTATENWTVTPGFYGHTEASADYVFVAGTQWVEKRSATDGSLITNLSLAANLTQVMDLYYHGGYLYVIGKIGSSTPYGMEALKIDVTDMSIVAEYTNTSYYYPMCIYCDGTAVFAGGKDENGNSNVIKLNLDLTESGYQWNDGVSSDAYIKAIGGDGTYIYCAWRSYGDPDKVYKLQASDLTEVAYWQGDSDHNLQGLVMPTSSVIIVAGKTSATTGIIYRIDPTTMSEVWSITPTSAWGQDLEEFNETSFTITFQNGTVALLDLDGKWVWEGTYFDADNRTYLGTYGNTIYASGVSSGSAILKSISIGTETTAVINISIEIYPDSDGDGRLSFSSTSETNVSMDSIDYIKITENGDAVVTDLTISMQLVGNHIPTYYGGATNCYVYKWVGTGAPTGVDLTSSDWQQVASFDSSYTATVTGLSLGQGQSVYLALKILDNDPEDDGIAVGTYESATDAHSITASSSAS